MNMNREYLKYLFAKPLSIAKLICRLRRHPYGIIYYNPGSWAAYCKGCHDDLGRA